MYRFVFAGRYADRFFGAADGLQYFNGWWAFRFFQSPAQNLSAGFYLASPPPRIRTPSKGKLVPGSYLTKRLLKPSYTAINSDHGCLSTLPGECISIR